MKCSVHHPVKWSSIIEPFQPGSPGHRAPGQTLTRRAVKHSRHLLQGAKQGEWRILRENAQGPRLPMGLQARAFTGTIMSEGVRTHIQLMDI